MDYEYLKSYRRTHIPVSNPKISSDIGALEGLIVTSSVSSNGRLFFFTAANYARIYNVSITTFISRALSFFSSDTSPIALFWHIIAP